MRVKHFACAGLIILGGLSGCATWQKPSADLATKIPVIEIGQPKPEGNEYILLVRAGKDIPVKLTVDGSFLSKEGATETTVNVRQDVYLYKQWSSFDGKEWERGLFQVLISAGVGPEGGNVDIKVNQPN
ncbi:MAG: hypothetical protein L0Z73_00405 [Gammaproteobacteria bacterium]|nr:hypothetical protein [Gammaproteobacteria bacterium]